MTASETDQLTVDVEREADGNVVPNAKSNTNLPDGYRRIDDRRGRQTVLLIPTWSCLTFRFEADEFQRLKRRGTLRYKLEERFTLDGDSLAIDSIRTDDGVLVIALVEAEALSSSWRSLPKPPDVVAVVPESLMVALAIMRHRFDLRTGRIALRRGDDVDVIEVRQGRINEWRWWRFAAVEPPLPIDGGDETFFQAADSLEWEAISPSLSDEPTDGMLQTECDAVLRGRRRPPLDLREGPLADWRSTRKRNAVLWIVAGLMLLAGLPIALAAWVGGNQLADSREKVLNRQTALFAELFPGEPVPVGIAARIEGERQRLQRSVQGREVMPAATRSAGPVLQALLTSLPDAEMVPYRLEEVIVEGDRVSMLRLDAADVETRREILTSLRAGGFQFSSPPLNQSDGRVALRLENMRLSSGDEAVQQSGEADR